MGSRACGRTRRGWIFRIYESRGHGSGASSMAMSVPVAIVGASGYSGEELCRILAGHPGVRIVAATSRQHAGRALGEALPRLRGHPRVGGVVFQDSRAEEVAGSGAAAAFLALPHGLAADYAQPLVRAGLHVVDLSADFRLRSAAAYEEFYGGPHPAPELLPEAIYGLPELHRERIRNARLVASAGCYPTSILLPLVPLLRARLVEPEGIRISSASGVSGAGRKVEASYLFGECHESLRAYGVPKHRHLSEIEQELRAAAGQEVRVAFVPHLAPMTRGIHTTIFAHPRAGEDDLLAALESAYSGEPFVRIARSLPDTKHVATTNFCDISVRVDTRTGTALLFSALDNLVKGAAGQAVQNFNIMAGMPETEGLL